MAISYLSGGNVPVHLWTDVQTVESQALDQLRNIARLPWVFHHVAVMPDVHFGKGATVGSVIAMKGAVSPAAVGVDIGCGMGAIKTNLHANDLPDNLAALRHSIERGIPVGFEAHNEPVEIGHNPNLHRRMEALRNTFKSLDPKVQDLFRRAFLQLGTLGGGNHFIELCLDTDGMVWMMLHSGSRNIGKSLAEIHIAKAKTLAHNAELPDKDLAVFLAGTDEMFHYWFDLGWAQEYAFVNRMIMFEIYKKTMLHAFPQITFGEPILCHHNYVSNEIHYGEDLIVTRKGAINADRGVMGIIPGSMGTKSYIVRGLGLEESFNSASHGAGRVMSRGAAKRIYKLEDLVKQTEGVECRKDAAVIDEIPAAYKDIDKVMKNQEELVEIVATLKQVLCIKG